MYHLGTVLPPFRDETGAMFWLSAIYIQAIASLIYLG
jgi:hypothetical protein